MTFLVYTLIFIYLYTMYKNKFSEKISWVIYKTLTIIILYRSQKKCCKYCFLLSLSTLNVELWIRFYEDGPYCTATNRVEYNKYTDVAYYVVVYARV